MPITDKLIQIEEKLNKKRHNAPANAEGFHKDISYEDLNRSLDIRGCGMTGPDYLIAMLPDLGYIRPDGEPDWVCFYKTACIEPSVWSTFVSNTHKPSKETLLKIVIAARMKESQARKFLSLSGSGFQSNDFRDNVILSCLELGYYDIEDVYMILETYGNEIVRGKRRFKNIYKEREKRNNEDI